MTNIKQFIKKLPLPITGLMLGLAAIGNLVQFYGEIYMNISGVISSIILGSLLTKLIIFLSVVKKFGESSSC